MSRHPSFSIARAAALGLSLTALALLAACSGKPDDAATSGPETSEPVLETPGVMETGAAAGDELVDTGSIPSLLQGRWGLVPADCTSDRGDAKGLLTVGPQKLEFYESVAELGEVKQIGKSEVTAAFAFSGEGQTWDLDVTLASPDGGKTMVRTDKGADAAPGPLTYRKCT